jgi:hypothetical protein
MAVQRFTNQSSHLETTTYDDDTQIMTITFRNGESYQYSGVPINVFQEFKQSGGGGMLFWALIRNRYATTHVRAAS